jgi:hypothetical protein
MHLAGEADGCHPGAGQRGRRPQFGNGLADGGNPIVRRLLAPAGLWPRGRVSPKDVRHHALIMVNDDRLDRRRANIDTEVQGGRPMPIAARRVGRHRRLRGRGGRVQRTRQ